MSQADRLSRQARVLGAVQENTQIMLEDSSEQFPGIHAGTIAEILHMDRANVARELNNLYRNGQLIKIQGKPTLYICRSVLSRKYPKVFFPSTLPKGGRLLDYISASAQPETLVETPSTEITSSLETMAGAYKTLKSAILHAKAAVMYPSHDLHVLITGNVGVGKGLLAQEMYTYAVSKQGIDADAPFITVNCRDQNVSPQLLMNQIFGCTRDAAYKEKKAQRGLIEKAAGGILYLNSIESLPVVVQDALITLLEKNTYTRMGEASVVRYSSTMLIASTTEEPDAASIAALRQRFSVRIHIPNLSDWSLREIAELLVQAFQKEASSTSLSFRVPKETFAAFLRASYPGNLGDLNSSVRTTCAMAVQEFFTTLPRPKMIEIRPHHLQAELLSSIRPNSKGEFELLQFFEELDLEYFIFHPNGFFTNRLVAPQLLKLLHREPDIVESTGTEDAVVISTVMAAVRPWMETHQITGDITQRMMEKQFSRKLVSAVRDTISNFPTFVAMTEEQENFYLLVCCVSDILKGKMPLSEEGYELRTSIEKICPLETTCAKALCKIVEREVSDFEKMVLVACLHKFRAHNEFCQIPILAVAHGSGIAEAMADYVNHVLGRPVVIGVSVLEEESFQELLNRVSDMVRRFDQGYGILFAVDMESLSSLHEYVFQSTGIRGKTVSNVGLSSLLSMAKFALREKITLYELHQEIIESMNINTSMTEATFLNRTVNEILTPSLTFLNPNKAIDALSTALDAILKELDIIKSNEIAVKFIFHGSHMLERLISGDSLKYDGLKAFVNQNSELIAIIERHMNYISEVFGVSIPASELAYLAEIVLPYLC